ncbi:mitochondrial ribosome-associated GTPase 2-like [Amphiura filiformis]|uniref:mitochondrial ribosome-associated GTPase 2-like n=1 Tax=Amphiura filiformis TaxID=82378 RepID=UPI003B20CF48
MLRPLIGDLHCVILTKPAATLSMCLRWLSSKKGIIKKKPDLDEETLSKHFIDWRRVLVIAGNGGNGTISLHHEASREFGGPDGGDGGNGADVVFQAESRVKSLEPVRHQYKAESGANGRSQNRTGKNGKHTIIQVPLGTVIKEDDTIIADLESEGDQFVAVRGGTGGRGNHFFVTAQTQTPMIAGRGTIGEEKQLSLELRTMAHAGLIGFPNAGKSSLLRALSRARPKVAAYPFTTLNPHVGMVQYDDLEQVAVADIPGLVHGAHMNKGLGHSFLRHIERCSCLLYVIDLSVDEPWTQLTDLKYELEQYQPGLSERPHAVVGNKIDLPESRTNLPLLEKNIPLPVIAISAQERINIDELKKHVRQLYDEDMKGRIKEKKPKVDKSRII